MKLNNFIALLIEINIPNSVKICSNLIGRLTEGIFTAYLLNNEYFYVLNLTLNIITMPLRKNYSS